MTWNHRLCSAAVNLGDARPHTPTSAQRKANNSASSTTIITHIIKITISNNQRPTMSDDQRSMLNERARARERDPPVWSIEESARVGLPQLALAAFDSALKTSGV